ncbi:23S rRNA (uracil-5-)-methyltransferase RumA [Arachidicoccus ginsenosidimutans]|uniref:23S rRNA (uracil(1939)-C(5))-methyltransferase RlmD n=1 Tax=Arachidicoccus sp. BS20 TaxID=1850526 RepID=UPI0007F14CFB|nr:23S rRNA (uracil(1939)-C(5))-methyltransferase RlmD [Arachidicoccus sp. BS20]ANI88633.1 23S rRNA (uracil-5-)-methyltransferase RumA [Arachidicoccus sp. BS20]
MCYKSRTALLPKHYLCRVRRKKERIIWSNVLVEDYAAEGKAIGKVEGKIVFIEKAVPGDVVDVQVSKNKKDWANAFPVNFVSYSKDRVEPFCAHFGICGGCSWQNLPYEKQLLYKEKQVIDQLTRIGKLKLPDISPIAGCKETTGYRNKMEYTFSTKPYIPKEEFAALKNSGEPFDTRTQQGVAGFHAKGFFDKVVEIDVCHLQKEPTNEIRKFIAQFARLRKIPFYDIKEHQGWLRNVLVRNTTTGELMINVVFGYEDKENREALLNLLTEKFPKITTLLYTINEKKNDSIYDLEPQVFSGKGFIIEKLEKFSYKISPKSFFQTNSKQAEKLYRITREFAELDGSQTLYDLYCGTGSIGIFCSKGAKKIIGVEVIPEAIEDAKENAQLNNIKHSAFFAGDVIDICNDDFFVQHGRPDVVITDPPRAGMHEKLVNKLLEMEAPLVVYVSCNPATQARDLALLSEKYEITKMQPVDMFPHTLHIENVAQLKLKKI